jgi:hypothetical protein
MHRHAPRLARILWLVAGLVAFAGQAVRAAPPGFDPGPGDGGIIQDPGPGAGFTLEEMIERGYTCRPYGGGHRCDGFGHFPTSDTYARSVFLCTSRTCTHRATKFFPDAVDPEDYNLWAFQFALTSKQHLFGDFDGEGAADLAAFGYVQQVGQVGQVHVGLSNGENELGAATQWHPSFCAAASAFCAVGQVTDDGASPRDDALSFDSAVDGVSVAVSSGASFGPGMVWSSGLADAGTLYLVGDWDGDGLDDVAAYGASRTGPSNLFVALNRVVDGIRPVRRFVDSGFAWITDFCTASIPCLSGDFDGDGRDDLARVRTTGAVEVALSNGTSRFDRVRSWHPNLGGQGVFFHVADMNGDGFDDLVGMRADEGVVVGISDGVEIAALVRVDELFCGDPAACRVADVNGDGHPDVVELVRATVLANPDTEQAGDVWVSLGGNLPGYPAPPARPAPADQESDGIADAADNCVAVANPGQEDADRDGIGDACELRADTNADGIVNLADLAYLRSKLFTSDPIADLNDDGIVNLLDVAILKNEFLKPPGPSNAIGEPVLEVHGLRHGLVYAPNTRSVWVGGFVRNVRPADLVLRIRSSAATIQPVVAADGWFSAFVAVDPGEFLNPIVIEAERRTPRARTKQRYVAALGESAAMGDLSPRSLGLRIQEWQIEELTDRMVAGIDLADLEESLLGPEITQAIVVGPLDVEVGLFSDQLVLDLVLPALRVHVDRTCDGWVNANGIRARLAYDAEPWWRNPSLIEAIELPGSPHVEIDDAIFLADSGVCQIAADILADVEAEVRSEVEAHLASLDFFHRGPVDGRLEDALNQIDISGVLASLGVEIHTRYRSVTEDLVGIGFALDTGVADAPDTRGEDDEPLPTVPVGRAPRIFQTGADSPPLPLWAPSGRLYDLALSLAPDALNQLLDAIHRNGTLAAYFEAESVDLADVNPALAADLAFWGLGSVVRFVPTMPPFVTGRRSEEGPVTDVWLGQLRVEIAKLDGSDAVRVAIDLHATLDFSLGQSLPGSFGSDELRIRVHGIEVLASEALHVPPGVTGGIVSFIELALLPELNSLVLAFDQPLPQLDGYELELYELTPFSNGGMQVFADLTPGGTRTDPGPVFP